MTNVFLALLDVPATDCAAYLKYGLKQPVEPHGISAWLLPAVARFAKFTDTLLSDVVGKGR